MADEYIEEHRQIERAYFLNPNDVECAINYSCHLKLKIITTISRPIKSSDELNAMLTLLKPLTEVYQRYSNNEKVAEHYLDGICWVSEYIGGDIIEKMVKIVNQFPNVERLKTTCGTGIYFFVSTCFERNDLYAAEKNIEILRKLYVKTGSESLAVSYAKVLHALSIRQGFFGKRNTLAELKKLTEQYPRNELIAQLYRWVQNPLSD